MKRTILFAVAWVVMFTAGQVQAAVILSDNFDSGVGVGFSSLSSATAFGNGLQGFLSGNALHFKSSSDRWATTVSLDVSAGAMIAFDFRGGNESVDGSTNWEDSDGSSEWADLSYSINGGSSFINFLELSTELDESENPTVWNPFDVAIPVAAQTSSTLFRWKQRNDSGSSYDHWAIDNLTITTPDMDPVPEPTSLAIFGIGALCMSAGAARRRRKEKQAAA